MELGGADAVDGLAAVKRDEAEAAWLAVCGSSLVYFFRGSRQPRREHSPGRPTVVIMTSKRKRPFSCGSCSACGREDCGRCINCMDKPKFGGQGVRKQSCMLKRCMQPKGDDDCRPHAETSMAYLLAPSGVSAWRKEACDTGVLGDEQDDPMFWAAVAGCMALISRRSATQTEPAAAPGPKGDEQRPGSSAVPFPTARQTSFSYPALVHPPLGDLLACARDAADSVASKRLRSARCGLCRACNSGDCGECKNCLDKPKFGGPGNRKQACTMRTCTMLRVVDECDPADEDEAGSFSAPYDESRGSSCEVASSDTDAPAADGVAAVLAAGARFEQTMVSPRTSDGKLASRAASRLGDIGGSYGGASPALVQESCSSELGVLVDRSESLELA